jgi:BCD family chlorophyll transporter-like MFS transporter
MIVELRMPASLVGLFFALLLMSPVRVWLGYRSDAYPLWDLRREPYIVFGSLLAGLGVTGAPLAVFNGTATSGLMIAATLLAFVIYGLGKNLSSNTFEALLADKFEGEQRPRAVTFFKVAMFIGIMAGAIGLGRLLDPFSTARMTAVWLVSGYLRLRWIDRCWGFKNRRRVSGVGVIAWDQYRSLCSRDA